MNMFTAYNRAYLASAIAFAKIHLRGTSDTLGTLGEIVDFGRKSKILNLLPKKGGKSENKR